MPFYAFLATPEFLRFGVAGIEVASRFARALFAPLVHMLFRPEGVDIRSSESDIVPLQQLGIEDGRIAVLAANIAASRALKTVDAGGL